MSDIRYMWDPDTEAYPDHRRPYTDAENAQADAALAEQVAREQEDLSRTARRKQVRAGRARLGANITKLRANSVKLKDKAAFDAMTAVAKAEALRLAEIDSTDGAADVTDGLLKLVEVLRDQGVFQPSDDQP